MDKGAPEALQPVTPTAYEHNRRCRLEDFQIEWGPGWIRELQAASIVLSIQGCPGARLMKSHASRWIPILCRNKVPVFRQSR